MKKKNILSSVFLLFSILTFFLGFYYGENSAGGGAIDYIHEINNQKILKQNQLDFLFNHDFYASRFPLFHLLIINTFNLISNNFSLKISVFLYSLIFPVILFLFLKNTYLKIGISEKFLIVTLFLFSPYFRTSSFWGLQENLSYILILITALLDLKMEKSDLKKFIILFFSFLIFYSDQKMFFFSIIYYIKYLDNKFFSTNNIVFSLYCSLLLIPALIVFYYWKGPAAYWLISGDSRFKFNFYGIINLFQISSLYIFPFLLILKKEKIYLLFKTNNNLYILFLILFLIIITFNYPPNFTLGGGFLQKIYIQTLKVNFYTANFIYIFLTTLSVIIVSKFSYLYKNDLKYWIFALSLVFISISVHPLFQEYFDPLINLILILFFLKHQQHLLKFKQLFFVNIYYFIFLISCFFYYHFFRVY